MSHPSPPAPRILISLYLIVLLFSSSCLSMMNAKAKRHANNLRQEFRRDINCVVGIEIPRQPSTGREFHFRGLFPETNRVLVIQLTGLHQPVPDALLTEHAGPLPPTGYPALLSCSRKFSELSGMILISDAGEQRFSRFLPRCLHLVSHDFGPQVHLSRPTTPFDLREDWQPFETRDTTLLRRRPGAGGNFARSSLYLVTVPLDVVTFPVQLLGAILK